MDAAEPGEQPGFAGFEFDLEVDVSVRVGDPVVRGQYRLAVYVNGDRGKAEEVGLAAFPPVLVITAELFEHVGIPGGEIGFLGGIGVDVVKFVAVNQTPGPAQDGCVGTMLRRPAPRLPS